MKILLLIIVIACLKEQSAWAQSSIPQCILQVDGATLIGGCVPKGRCNKATHTVYDDGSGIIDTRNGEDDPIECPPSQICCSIRSERNLLLTATLTEGCGYQKRQTVENYAKTKPSEADPGEFPWAVNIMATTDVAKRYLYVATGSLIHDRVVLTAAHLLHDKEVSKLRVLIGAHDQRKKVLAMKMLEVDEVVIHNNFNRSNGDHNIALLFLKTSALSAGLPHVGTVCLPSAGYVPPTGSNCVFAGWGVDSNWTTQDVLTKMEVPMVSHSECERKLRLHPKLGPGFQLLASYTCAGGEPGRDICGGAGGSPLVCPHTSGSSRYVQTGLVTWVAKGCGVDGSPTVFADVAAARPWVDQQMASHQYSTDSYTY